MVEKETEKPQTEESQEAASEQPEPAQESEQASDSAEEPTQEQEQPQEKPKAAARKKSRKRSAKPKPQIAVPADGTLLRKDGDPIVYVMHEGQRRPFADAPAFLAYNHGWSGITVLPSEEIDPIPQGPEVTGPADLQ